MRRSRFINLIPTLINLKTCVLSVGCQSRALHLVYKFDKQIARYNNALMKILNFFDLPHVKPDRCRQGAHAPPKFWAGYAIELTA